MSTLLAKQLRHEIPWRKRIDGELVLADEDVDIDGEVAASVIDQALPLLPYGEFRN